MDKTKGEILSQLYAIKAGLSVISMEREKLKKEEDNIRSCENKVNENRDGIIQTKKQIFDLNNIIEATEAESKNTASKEVKVHNKKSIEFDDYTYSFKLFFKTGFFCCALYFGYMIIYWMTDKNNRKPLPNNFHEICWIIIAIITFAVPFFYLLSVGLECKSKNNEKKEKLERELKNEKFNLANRLDSAKKSIKENEEKLVKLESQTDLIAATFKDNLIVYNQNADVYTESCKIVYDSLVSQYNLTLNSSEWKNLDLIIYYFETGRADSIKEALQLLDQQIHHDELVATLKEATDSICGSIQNSINALRSDMIDCFEKLSIQMAKQQKETINKLNKIDEKIDDTASMVNSSIKMLNYNLSEIISQEKLHSALLAKVNVGSSELVSDANYMLSYRKNYRA